VRSSRNNKACASVFIVCIIAYLLVRSFVFDQSLLDSTEKKMVKNQHEEDSDNDYEIDEPEELQEADSDDEWPPVGS